MYYIYMQTAYNIMILVDYICFIYVCTAFVPLNMI